jgi:hypothetical protein
MNEAIEAGAGTAHIAVLIPCYNVAESIASRW